MRVRADGLRQPYRVMWLPWRLGDGSGQFDIFYPYAVNPQFGTAQTSQSRQYAVIDLLYRYLLAGDGQTAGRLLRAANVRFVVVNMESPDITAPIIEYPYFAPALVGNPEALDALVQRVVGFQIVREAGGVRVYEDVGVKPFVWSPAGVEIIRIPAGMSASDVWSRWVASRDHEPGRWYCSSKT